MRKTRWIFLTSGVFFGIAVLIAWWATTPRDEPISDRSIPLMMVDLNGVGFETITEDKQNKFFNNSVSLIDDDGKVVYGGVEISGHGNTTWQSGKKPFQLKFPHKVNLLELGSSKKWLLIANLFDATNLRNDVALYVGRMLDMEYTTIGDFLELEIDGESQGLYYLVPKIDISKNSVNLHDPMGVLVELDNLHNEKKCYYSAYNMCLTIKDIVNRDNEDKAMEMFLVDFGELEIAAEQGYYDKVADLVDVTSFAKYFLLSEFTVNPDAYTSSWYMYKDGAEDKIHAGPGWDFDFSFGNRNWIWNAGDKYFSPQDDMAREIDALGGRLVFDEEIVEVAPDWGISRVMFWLMKIPEFKSEVQRVFGETMAGRKDELLGRIKNQYEKIHDDALANNERWEQGDFESDFDYLYDWIDQRYEHFEQTYGGNEEHTTVELLRGSIDDEAKD